ncbi:tRNA preQ1(34) S-adenosylmethionine ribosyltransferase-isomerase QueA [Cohaesibacter sp. CAU 1516]|uniref:tRNA preQ1(34) S-adenosylmethionine ribosyltransferase-isomerase QueA n=1 Tax=Cohaesibacter sp. CAU 1516 TaxID=2576038 RepID=UPI0010FDE175|nr:tRNA preQ1(34) S-adenosylmethionine ribosyltransferase-isomerase QueA [Cohaesibacter sp. CAU 1516]TLP49104.1 tRNA preQ1(34) S-adenosylmethionine ribosyltransferase-isomerase QueA [Cohaesibacter sp. CAU 1516]
MRVDLFDFDLPAENIALRPHDPRDEAKLLLVPPSGAFETHRVLDLADFLQPGDALVFNDTKVIPAELAGTRVRGDIRAGIHFNLHKREDLATWRAFARPAKKVQLGDRIEFGSHLSARILEKGDAGEVVLQFDAEGASLDAAIAEVGHIPLPPYIASKRAEDERDKTDYQTIYAREEGAVAAPTAGLHFTDRLFDALDAKGIERHFVTLHVGAGTFLPVKADDTEDHVMHAEWGEISPEMAARLNEVHARGNRIIAVGTTSLRLLESATDEAGVVQPFCGDTAIFITPGYRFRAIDGLMTNFHLPKSTLFMLVSAIMGQERMQAAYAHAIKNGYRFYSYGDSSLLLRP